MKETKIAKEVSTMELLHAGLPIFVIALIGVFIIKVFFQETLSKGLTILLAWIISFMLINIGGFGIYRFWRQLK